MGKVKGQFDFCRMTWGHLSFAELMSCQCRVKGGRGAALLMRAHRPLDRVPHAAPALGLEVQGSTAQAGALDTLERVPPRGLATEEERKPMQSQHCPLFL